MTTGFSHVTNDHPFFVAVFIPHKERKGKERKCIYLYSAFYTMYISKLSGIDHTVLPANTPCLPFLRKRSPDGATSN